MKFIEIPKRSGGVRKICVPGPKRKRRCRDSIPTLQAIVRQVCDLEVVHGFAELRSPVTNALKHVGYEYTLSFDLKDFFDHVKFDMVEKVLRSAKTFPRGSATVRWLRDRSSPSFHDKVARQGLPTSPILANIAAAAMDKEILEHIGQGKIVYTRYADDLCFSFDSKWSAGRLKYHVPLITKRHGFVVNDKKTRLQWAKVGRRIITGVAVDDKGIHPTRAFRRRLRAAIHNAKTGRVKHFPKRQWTRYVKTCKYHGRAHMPKQVWLKLWLHKKVKGLEEWAKLRPPTSGHRSAARIVDTINSPQEAMSELASRGKPG